MFIITDYKNPQKLRKQKKEKNDNLHSLSIIFYLKHFYLIRQDKNTGNTLPRQ